MKDFLCSGDVYSLCSKYLPKDEIDHHESDLYVKVSPESTRIVIDLYQFRNQVTTFVSQIDGSRWYDVPFAYIPWYLERIAARTLRGEE